MDSFYLPDIFDGHYETSTAVLNGGIEVSRHVLKPSFFDAGLAAFYESAFKILESYKIKDIIDELDGVSRLFLDAKNSSRKSAIEAISAVTGFSRESVALSVDLEFSSSLKPQMTAALKNEFGSLEILDDFVYDAGNERYSRALPAGPVFAVSSSNIPALPHLSVMRAFLTKNPAVVKTSFAEPIFTPLYMRAFKDAGSLLAQCAAAVCYKSSENIELTEKFIDSSNIIIAYGGLDAEKYFAGRVRYPKKLIMHPHRLGFGLIGEGFTAGKSPSELDELAAAAARDVVTFDQRACLAPHVYFYCVKNNVPAESFIKHLTGAFETLEKEIPPAALSDSENYSRRNFIDSMNFEKGVRDISETASGKSAVIDIKPSRFPLSPLNRVLFLARYEEPQEVAAILKTVKNYTQNAALCVLKDDEAFWFDILSRLGVSRICRAGEMPAPTMLWRHDGIGALIEMTRFCDIEKY